jgi:hypothetical protein
MNFDPQSFLNNTAIEGAMETKFVTCPAGEYNAPIIDVAARSIKDKTTGEESPIVDVIWGVSDAAVQAATGMEVVKVRQSIFIDLTPQGGLASGPGKNIQLGRLREALKQNDPSVSWNFNMLKNAVAKIKVEHSPNPKDITNPYANVTAVAPL